MLFGTVLALALLLIPLDTHGQDGYIPVGGMLLFCAGEVIFGTLLNPVGGWVLLALLFVLLLCWLHRLPTNGKKKTERS